MADIKEFEKSIKISLGALVFGIAFIISLTFSATTIYLRFGATESQIRTLENKVEQEILVLEKRIEYVDGRIDKKFKQAEEKIEKIKK